jgi:hypothetical protein
VLDFRQSSPIPFSDRRAIPVEEFQRRGEVKNTGPGWAFSFSDCCSIRPGLPAHLWCGTGTRSRSSR